MLASLCLSDPLKSCVAFVAHDLFATEVSGRDLNHAKRSLTLAFLYFESCIPHTLRSRYCERTEVLRQGFEPWSLP